MINILKRLLFLVYLPLWVVFLVVVLVPLGWVSFIIAGNILAYTDKFIYLHSSICCYLLNVPDNE